MQELAQGFNDVVDVLSSNKNRVTVFLADDDAMSRAAPHVTALLRESRDQVYNVSSNHSSNLRKPVWPSGKALGW